MTKKIFAIVLVVVLIATLIPGVALAGRNIKGNDLPKGKSYNFNVIGVPNQKNWDPDSYDTGGNGKRIFVLRDLATTFYVHGAEDTFAILDHDGTDGKVGWGQAYPGLILPYEGTLGDGEWTCEVYVRLLGPNNDDTSVRFTSYVWDGVGYVYLGDMQFTQDRGTKFICRTNKLLADNYQDILWYMDQKTNFRIMQFRIFVEPS